MQQHVYSIALTCRLLGVKHVVISPGSRSAPLVFAFTNTSGFQTHVVVDERSAAYQALGIAQQTQKPVVLICTSGTAAANYYPAVAEAFYQRIPLLVLTADRPSALLNQQDGQMINQVGMFGTHVRASYQLACYQQGSENHRETTGVVAEALAKTAFPVKGPVHINVPLAEPLYPEKTGKNTPNTLEKQIYSWLSHHVKQPVSPAGPDWSELEYAWINSKKRIVLIGQGPIHEKWITPLLKLKGKGDVVILTDVASNMHAYATIKGHDKLIASLDASALNKLKPEFLLTLGGPVLSKSLKNWLKEQTPNWHFRVQTEPELINTYANVTHYLDVRVEDVLWQLAEINWHGAVHSAYRELWEDLYRQLDKKLGAFIGKEQWSEMHLVHRLLQTLPEGANLQLANSSVVRYVSWLGGAGESILVNSNRGTSGIDGCTSTALGAALVNQRPTVLLTGDLAFLYDNNALWRESIPPNLRIVVLNNGGGGIFSLIDGPARFRNQEPYFTTPHGRSVKSIATENGLDYYFCDSFTKLKQVLSSFFEPENGPAVLELKVDMKQNAKAFKVFKNIKVK